MLIDWNRYGTVVHKIEEDEIIHSRNTNRNHLVDKAITLIESFIGNVYKKSTL